MKPTSLRRPRIAFVASAFFAACALCLLAACGGGGGGGSSTPVTPDIPPPSPQLLSIQPEEGHVGTPVELTGLNLGNVVTVTFPPDITAAFTVVSDGRITTTVPVGAQQGMVRVVDSRGLSAYRLFIVTAPETSPVLSEVQPSEGAELTSLVLTGRNLSGVVGVTFTPGIAAPFTAESDTRVTATVPPGATSGTITVTDIQGRTSAATFTVKPALLAPVLESFQPETATAFTMVTLAGTGFTGASEVAFGGKAASYFRVVDDTEIRASVPIGSTSGKISVTTPGGTASSNTDFTYDSGAPQAPTISSMSPESGPVDSYVRLTGRGMLSVTEARLSGTRATFTAIGDSDLTLRIPAGASSGRVTLTTAGGATTTSPIFTVTTAPVAAPAFLSFTPQTAPAGGQVRVYGTGLSTVSAVTVGGVRVLFVVTGDDSISLWIPGYPRAVSGPIVLTLPTGSLTHPTPFRVQVPPPLLDSMNPTSGPAGTAVWLEGTGLADVTEIRFGSTPATSVVFKSAGMIKVLVPAGATAGPVTVVSPGGEAQSFEAFTPRAGGSTADIRIAGLYVTQATQRMDRSVPLVAGRTGRVRVFLEAGSYTALRPRVRVTVANAAGATLVVRDIAPPSLSVPLRTDDTTDRSWDFTLDGALIQPGITIKAEILGTDGSPDLSRDDSRFPSTGGALPLNVVAVPPIGLTLIPVNQGGRVGRVSNSFRTLDSWLTLARKVWPFKDIDLVQAPVLNWNETFGTGMADIPAWIRLRLAIEAARLAADPGNRRYHYGVIDFGPGPHDVTGLGFIPESPASNLKRAGIGWDAYETNASNYYDTYAHELGHNLGRRHSPCGGAEVPDPAYPYPDGGIGATGYDVATDEVKRPALQSDVMSYCPPIWISDYTYKGVMTSRAGEPMYALASIRPQPGLLVWGTINNGQVKLEPAMQLENISDAPEPGDHTLLLRDASGAILKSVPFQASGAEDLPQGENYRSFAFVIPFPPEHQAALASLEVVSGAQARDLGGPAPYASLGFAAASGVALPREPEAVAWGPGVVHLSWDAATHPLVIVKNAATGDVIGIVKGGSADLITDAVELDLNLSAGIRSIGTRVKVRP